MGLALGLCGSAQAHSVLGHIHALHLPPPPVQILTVINRANVSPLDLVPIEQAVLKQTSNLRRHWGTPTIAFGRGGWPVWLVPTGTGGMPPGVFGFHWYNVTGIPDTPQNPYAMVNVGGIPATTWSVYFSHEILELLVNPRADRAWANGGPLEVCDPVAGTSYTIDGVNVADFVYPRWANTVSPGPWDATGYLAAPKSAST